MDDLQLPDFKMPERRLKHLSMDPYLQFVLFNLKHVVDIEAVRKILAEGRYVSVTMAKQLAADIGLADQALHEGLTNREYSVLQLLASGKSIKEIANKAVPAQPSTCQITLGRGCQTQMKRVRIATVSATNVVRSVALGMI